MIRNKLTLLGAAFALLLLNACGTSEDTSLANSCENSYVILSQAIDKHADGTIDQTQNYEYNEDALLTRIYDVNSSEDVRLFSYNEEGQNIYTVDYTYIFFEHEIEYKYDTFGRISSGHVITTYQNDNNNSFISNEEFANFYNNDYIFEYTYENNKIATMTLSRDGAIFEVFYYMYDNQGNIVKDTLLNRDGEIIGTTNYNNTYDNNGNLIRVDVDINEDGLSDDIHEYIYDDSGNIIEEYLQYTINTGQAYETFQEISIYEWGCI